MSQPLEYARRDQLDISVEREFIAREHARRVGMWLRLVAGVPASFAAPFLLACLFFAVFLRHLAPLGLWATFAMCSVVLVPLMYWRASLHRTDYLGEAAVGLDVSNPYRADSYGELELRNGILAWGAYQELFFWGPHLVMEAIETWRADQGAVAVTRVRAGQIVRELLGKDSGVAPRSLRQDGESEEHFRRTLRYLAVHDWIDFSRRGDRVWLLTEARDRLTKPSA